MSEAALSALKRLDSLPEKWCWSISRSRVCVAGEYRLQIFQRKQNNPGYNWSVSCIEDDIGRGVDKLMGEVANYKEPQP